MFHCGVARVWLASSFVILCAMGYFEGASVERRFKDLTEASRTFCAQNHLAMHVNEFTRDNLGFEKASWPVGKWNKGAASTHMMLFLQHFLERRIVGQTEDTLLLAMVPCLTIEKILQYLSIRVPYSCLYMQVLSTSQKIQSFKLDITSTHQCPYTEGKGHDRDEHVPERLVQRGLLGEECGGQALGRSASDIL